MSDQVDVKDGSVEEARKKMEDCMLELEKEHAGQKSVNPEALDDEKKAVLKQVTAKLEDAKVPDLDQHELVKFMLVNEFDADKTAAAFQAYRKWREDSKLDALFKNPNLNSQHELLKMIFPHSFFGFTKTGEPLYIEKAGQIATHEIAEHVDLKNVLLQHAWGMEKLAYMMKDSSARLGKKVHQFTTILDLTGLGLGHRNILHVLKATNDMDLKYFPERISKVFVINTPGSFIAPAIYELVKAFLDASTKSKVYVLGQNYQQELQKYIDADQLPAEYGGTSQAVVPVYTDAERKEFTLRDATGKKLTEEHVAAGYDFQVELKGKKGDTFEWSFQIGSGYDINFSIDAFPASNEDKPTVVKATSRCTSNKGEYVAPEDCRLVLTFDNSYSYWNGKDLRYHAAVVPKA